MAMTRRVKWLDRRIACPGPYLTLCLSQEEFDAAMAACKCKESVPFVKNGADATTHHLQNASQQRVCLVCVDGFKGRDPVEVAGMLVHEAVHIWQEYADAIGETAPGREQEAYAIQAIAQELLAEFARRAKAWV